MEGAVSGELVEGKNDEKFPQSSQHQTETNMQNKENPLQNPLILKNLFQCCTARDLSHCRVVSTTWHDLSYNLWKKLELPIILSVEDDPSSSSHQIRSRKVDSAAAARPMKDFMQCFANGGGGDVAARGINYHPTFELRAQTAPKLSSQTLLDSFWNQVGTWMTKLILRDFVFPNLNVLRELVLCERTPNLETLEVLITKGIELLKNNTEVVEIEDGITHGKLKTFKMGMRNVTVERQGRVWMPVPIFPFSWNALLSYYPKLETLALYTGGESMWEQVKPCLAAIKDIQSDDTKPKLALKSLSWFDEDDFCGDLAYLTGREYSHPWLPPVIFDLLRDCKLELTSLGILSPPPTFTNDTMDNHIYQTLEACRTSLRQLSLHKRDFSLGKLLPLGMSQLQYICVVGCPEERSMGFLRNIPSTVRTLKIFAEGSHFTNVSQDYISKTREEEMAGVDLSSLKTFCCSFYNADYNDWSRGDILRLRGWMSNLTRLEMVLTNEGFRTVCQSFPNLEHIRVYGENVGDEGITGQREVDEGQVVYEQPNLTNLQKLQSFVIDSHRSYAKVKERITEVSVHQGFLKLPLLQKLLLRTYWLVTPAAKSLLEERLNFAKIEMREEESVQAGVAIAGTKWIEWPEIGASM